MHGISSKMESEGGKHIRSRSIGTGASRIVHQVPSSYCDDCINFSDGVSFASTASVLSERSRKSDSTQHSVGSSSSHVSYSSRASDSIVASQQRRNANVNDNSSKKTQCDPFGVHALGIESLSISSFSSMIGSLVTEPRKEKQHSIRVLRDLRRGAATRTPSPSLAEGGPLMRTPTPRVVDLQLNDHVKMQRIIEHDGEALPRPKLETERIFADYARSRSGTSTPVKLPSRSSQQQNQTVAVAHSSEEEEKYLSRLYNIRTWNMYKLINEARSQQDHEHYELTQKQNPYTNDQLEAQADMTTPSSSHGMMFHIDME